MAPDPNAKLIQQIKHLENMISDLKKDVRFQRREISALRAEQKLLFDKEKTPDYNSGLDALEQLSELDQQLYLKEEGSDES
jgi:hypothetical protein